MICVQVKAFDRVLVDGRARTSCAEYVLKYLKPDSVVFIHVSYPAQDISSRLLGCAVAWHLEDMAIL